MSIPLNCLNQDVLDVIRSLQDADDPNLLDEIIHLYLDTSKEQVETLTRTSKDVSELDAMRIAAHTLKGSSANVGAHRLTEACFAVESKGRAGSTDGLELAMTELLQEYDYACQALTAELSQKAA